MKRARQHLNPQQQEAVGHSGGPLLIIAGAGAGKTRTLSARITRLIEEGTPPEEILAITFTNKAAEEMRERVTTLLAKAKRLREKEKRHHITTPYDKERMPFVSTFHALGVHILRSHGKEMGVSPHFLIYDRRDSLKAVKRAIRRSDGGEGEWKERKVLAFISAQKNRGVSLSEFGEDVRGQRDEMRTRIWREYQKIKKEEKALDFDDLLLEPLKLFRRHPEIASIYQRRWSHIHIDEFQDTNVVQYELVRLLAEQHNNVCAVADMDQTIYTWRGARVRNVLSFEKDFAECRTIILEQNYRSTQTILSAANEVISKNKLRKEKNLFTKNREGEAIGYVCALDETWEARFVALKAKELIESGIPAKEIAVLYRTNFQSRALEEMCLAADVPYTLLGTRFFERKEVRDVLSYLRLAFVPGSSSDLVRIIDVPKRGIGKVTLGKMMLGKTGDLTPAMRKRVEVFREMIEDFSKKARELPASKMLIYIIKESGLEESFAHGGDEEKERLENIRELVTLALKYNTEAAPGGSKKLLEDAALMSDQDALSLDENERAGIRLMTVHASKGLEFDYVFITGLEDGLFPQEREEDLLEMREEERRLFYVALTRARKKVVLTHASARTIFGSKIIAVPSRFLSDISPDLFEDDSESILGKITRNDTVEYLDIDKL